MKRTALILLAVIGLFSCKKEPEAVSVPFEKLDHYFATIEVTSPTTRKIMDQETLDEMFSPAFSMTNPQAPLDFSKEFVIAVVNPTTDEATKLNPVSLVKEKDGLVYTYSEKIGEKTGSTRRPCLLIRVDKQYDAPLQVIKVQD